MKSLLDTDTCVFWLRGSASVRNHLEAVDLESVAVSVVTLAELRYGADCSTCPEDNHQAIDNFVNGITILDTDSEVARSFGEIKARLRKEGKLIEDFDLLIAATAQVHNLCLVTNNVKHFNRIDDLRLENWVTK
ncbi:MAG: PIN domain nuclease [Chloroflexota bacterium]|nr:MAG: PIN domain nuclease [Chloroflexota bacterium]